MALNHHLIDNMVALIGSCALPDLLDPDADPTFTDPTVITFIRQDPSGVQTEYMYGADPEVTKLTVGIYACVVTVLAAGTETWAFVTTGTCECRAEHAFVVDPSALS